MTDRTTKHCDVCSRVIGDRDGYIVVGVRRIGTPETIDVCSRTCFVRVATSFDALPAVEGVPR